MRGGRPLLDYGLRCRIRSENWLSSGLADWGFIGICSVCEFCLENSLLRRISPTRTVNRLKLCFLFSFSVSVMQFRLLSSPLQQLVTRGSALNTSLKGLARMGDRELSCLTVSFLQKFVPLGQQSLKGDLSLQGVAVLSRPRLLSMQCFSPLISRGSFRMGERLLREFGVIGSSNLRPLKGEACVRRGDLGRWYSDVSSISF